MAAEPDLRAGGLCPPAACLCRNISSGIGGGTAGGVWPLELALAARLGRYGRGERDLVALFESLRYKRPDLRALLTYLFVFYCQAHLLIERYSATLPPVPQNSPRVKIA